MLPETKTKSKKFRIRWSKVPRVLELLKSSYGHFSHPAGHGRFKPKNTQNGNKSRFPGAMCIFSKCCTTQKRRARNSASNGQKYRAFLEPLKSSYGHFSHPAGHGRLKPKNTQNGNKSWFPGATCIFSKCCNRQKRRARNSASNGQKYRAFLEPLKSSYGHFSHPAGHGRLKPKNTQNGNKSWFSGATCIFSKCCNRQKRRARNSASDGQRYRAFWSP